MGLALYSRGITGLSWGCWKIKALDPDVPKSSKTGISSQQHSQASEFSVSQFICSYLFLQTSVARFAEGDQQQSPESSGPLTMTMTRLNKSEGTPLASPARHRATDTSGKQGPKLSQPGPCFPEQWNFVTNVDMLQCKQRRLD